MPDVYLSDARLSIPEMAARWERAHLRLVQKSIFGGHSPA